MEQIMIKINFFFRYFIVILFTLFLTISVSISAKEEKEEGDKFKEPKDIKALASKAESLFSAGDWIGTRKYLYQYLGNFEAPDKSKKKSTKTIKQH